MQWFPNAIRFLCNLWAQELHVMLNLRCLGLATSLHLRLGRPAIAVIEGMGDLFNQPVLAVNIGPHANRNTRLLNENPGC